jgi:hypothetical protein
MEDSSDVELKDALAQGKVSAIADWLEGRSGHDIAE